MSEKGLRYNEGKRKWSLVDFDALSGMVEVLEFGACKYAPYNWKKGLPTTEICESMLRHIFAYLNGETVDPESGISHVGHIQCNAMFLGNMSKRNEWDDREKKNQVILDGDTPIDPHLIFKTRKGLEDVCPHYAAQQEIDMVNPNQLNLFEDQEEPKSTAWVAINKLIQDNPNDIELGKKVRKLFKG